METTTVTFVKSPDGDWVQIYKGDEFISEGHSVQTTELLEALGINVRSMETTQEFAEMGSWPQDLSQFPAGVLREIKGD